MTTPRRAARLAGMAPSLTQLWPLLLPPLLVAVGVVTAGMVAIGYLLDATEQAGATGPAAD